MTHEGYCVECERDYAHHEGPQSARYYGFAIREIAAALMRVGQGASYCEAASYARNRANRWPTTNEGAVRLSRHGQLVGDWVEVFAPIVYEPFKDDSWPTTGSVLLDELPFMLNRGTHAQKRSAFSILAVMGWDKTGKRIRLYKLQASPGHPSSQQGSWERLLQSLPGQPKRIVCDQGVAIKKAVSNVWPEAHVHYCEYHLRRRCYETLKNVGLNASGIPAHDLVERAFDSFTTWDRFKQEWWGTKRPKLRQHIKRIEPLVLKQLEHKPPYPRPSDPFTTGALEENLNWLRKRLDMRASTMTNRERLNRALLLMQLERNGRANEASYARSIHKWLLSNQGRPNGLRRTITDQQGKPSLRP
jgi:hypothetical protein